MTPEQQEARSRQHERGVQVVPLESNRFAIFQQGEFIEARIVYDRDELSWAIQEISKVQIAARQQRDRDRAPAVAGSSPLSLKDLGL